MKEKTTPTLKFLTTALVVLGCSSAFAADAPAANSGDQFGESQVITKQEVDAAAKKVQSKTDAITEACRAENGQDSNLCKIFKVTHTKKGWTVTTSAGVGQNNQYGGTNGTNFYMSNTTTTTSSQPYYGVQLKYENIKCDTEISVDKSYYALNEAYINQLSKPIEGEGLLGSFPPAAQQVIMLYVAMMEKAANGGGCQ